MLRRESITQEELKSQLHYDKDTGIFTRLISTSSRSIVGDIAGSKNSTTGYIEIMVLKKSYQAHRLAWLYKHGYFPELHIDHKDRIRHHNWIDNLREASVQCNARNCNIRSTNTSGITGVYWHEKAQKWVSQIKVSGKQINLGQSKSKVNAARTRWNAEVKYEFPNCNTISSAYLYLKERNLV